MKPLSNIDLQKPSRWEAVCVKLGQHILHGDIYVGQQAKCADELDKLREIGVPYWNIKMGYGFNYAKVGQNRELLTNPSWEINGPGGYWVVRPVYEEENEFGRVMP